MEIKSSICPLTDTRASTGDYKNNPHNTHPTHPTKNIAHLN
jgi:hypothetical protein